MKRTLVPGLLVALLVVVAGCAGGGGPDVGPVGDDGDAPGGGAGTDATDGGDGAADGAVVAEDQTAALEAAGGYTSEWRMRRYEDGDLVGQTSYVTAIDYEQERYRFEVLVTDHGKTRTSATAYYADGRSYQRLGEGDDVTYASAEADFETISMSGTSRAAFVSSVGDLDGFSKAGTETYDGVTVQRYVMDKRPAWIAAQSQTGEDGIRWTDFSYEVLVDDQGIVRAERWHSTGVDDEGVEKSVEFGYELTGVGTTSVSEPDWLAEASS